MQPDAPAQASPDPWVPYAVTAIAGLLAGLYGLAASSANLHDFYTPAVVSMSQGLGQFVYGAFDSAGWSGIDKIPGSLWPQALSVAAFGPSAWSVVLPEVLATIATVVVLYLAVARWRGRMAGLVAAAVYATTPLVAVLSRSNVPEVWFSLAAVISAYFLIRAMQTGRLPWLILAGLGIAAAFQVKMMEAWMLYPAMAVATLVGSPRSWPSRLGQTAIAGLISIAASLAWVVLVTVTPAAQRPWVGGTTDDSAWSMVFGYNGFGRVTGAAGSFVADFAGDPGLSRLIGPQIGVDVDWFLPLAIASIVTGLVAFWPKGRTTPRAMLGGYLFFGLWLVVVGLVMAFSAGIHTFYVLAYAPAIAALVGGLAQQARDGLASGRSRILATCLIALQLAWSIWLITRSSQNSWLIIALPAITLIGLAMLLAGMRAGLAISAAGLLLAPMAWVASSTGPLDAINPTAGPATMPGGGVAGGGPGAADPGGRGPGGLGPGGPGPGGARPGIAASFVNANAAAIRDWLQAHASGSRYQVAADSRAAGALIMAGTPGVIALGGGFHGADPTPTAAELASLVESGQLRYVIVSPDDRGPGPMADASAPGTERDSWIAANCGPVPDAPLVSGASSGRRTGTLVDCAVTAPGRG